MGHMLSKNCYHLNFLCSGTRILLTKSPMVSDMQTEVTSEINLTAVAVSSIKKACIDRKLNEPGKRKVISTEHTIMALCLGDIHPKCSIGDQPLHSI